MTPVLRPARGRAVAVAAAVGRWAVAAGAPGADVLRREHAGTGRRLAGAVMSKDRPVG